MPETLTMSTVVLTLDLIGTAVFAVSGAATGMRHRLDIFGICVLAFVAGTAGGMLRDVLLGAVPPAVLREWHHAFITLLAAVVTMLWHPRIERLRMAIHVFDAAGLALFAVIGTQKALLYALHPAVAAALGMLSGIGGGIVRDLLVREIPTVLRAELYAVAALAGASVVVVGHLLDLSQTAPTLLLGAALCFFIRIMAIVYGWSLPTADRFNRPPPEQ